MSLSHKYETLDKDINNLQSNFTQLLTSGCHYNTSEITNHIKHINNALDNIKLDHEFQRGSKNWVKQFDSNEMKLNEMNIQQLITKGNQLTQQLDTRLHTAAIKNKEHNQIREIHNWACDSLLEYLQSLHPYASGSYARLDKIAHDLGVTDRYIGYRNNLTRNVSQPVDVHTIWADRKLPPESIPDWKDWTHSFSHNDSLATNFEQSSNNNQELFDHAQTIPLTEDQQVNTIKKISSQSFVYANDYDTHMRKAGINLKYPGRTEFFDRYTKLEGPSSSVSLSVAQPDYTLTGRPLAHLVPDSMSTEYTEHYKFPDASKVEKFPWLRH